MSFQKKSLISNHSVVKKAILAKSVGAPTATGSISAPKMNMKAAKVATKASTKAATKMAMKASPKAATKAALKAAF